MTNHRLVTMTERQLKYIDTNQLRIAYWDIGPSSGKPVFLMHGFPYDVHAYTEVAKRLSTEGYRCIVPFLRGFGSTTFISDDTLRSGQQAAIAHDLVSLMDALSVQTAIVGGYDWGGRAACIAAALWPERIDGLVSGGVGYNIQNIGEANNPAPPDEEQRYWYIYYFHTDRGIAGLTSNRKELCKHIWHLWSPTWDFDNETYNQTANAFDNTDFVETVIHSYRHRFGIVSGDPLFDEIEEKLSEQPNITVPTIVLQGNDDGVDPPTEADSDIHHFTGGYERRIIEGAGHNLPQEAPIEFSDAVLSLN